MRYALLLIILVIFTSCRSDKKIELPEIEEASITEVIDVSPAYLFYNETQPDSIELNRKNLISTTNWLVNVDKRLTLDQAIPKIQFLQEKKRNSSHKNEKAKNYFTCHDLSKNNLGFIEFTNVVYKLEKYNPLLTNSAKNSLLLSYKKDHSTMMYDIVDEKIIGRGFFNLNKSLLNNYNTIILSIDKELPFQDYITLKHELIKLNSNDFVIHPYEFIY